MRGEQPRPTRGDTVLRWTQRVWRCPNLEKNPAIPLGNSNSSDAHQQINSAALRTWLLRRGSSLHDNGSAQMLQLVENFGQEKENSGFKTYNPVMNCVEGWMAAALWGR